MKPHLVYDRIAKQFYEYIESEGNFWNEMYEKPATIETLKSLGLQNKKILDLGCGSGRYTKILINLGAKVWGTDPSEKLIKLAKAKIRGVEFAKGSGENLPYPSSFFDMVFAGLVVDYFKDPYLSFAEINRVLKEDGIFLFSAHVPYTALTKTVKHYQRPTFTFQEYFKEGAKSRNWGITKMPYYHHTFQTIINALLNNNFTISGYYDMKPIPKSQDKFPDEYKKSIARPKFYLLKANKVFKR